MVTLRSLLCMKLLPKLIALLVPVLAIPAAVVPTGASAASGPDLGVGVVASGSLLVNTTTHIDVRLTNTGNRDAFGIWASIQLPKTNTSPTATVMGTVSNVPSYCQRQPTRLYCNLSASVPRYGGTTSIGFDIVMPVSADPITFRADAGANNEQNLANNAALFTPAQTYYTPTVPVGGAQVLNSHCTGTALSSYFECSPGSIMSHPTILTGLGTLDYSPVSPGAAAVYSGTWSVNGSQLTMQQTTNGQVSGNFVGQGSTPNCWDGRMQFVNSTYVAMYRVCL
jgi:hypothetical protein